MITLAHKGKDIENYLNIAFEGYDFEFVYIDDIESENSGPGYSALCAKNILKDHFIY